MSEPAAGKLKTRVIYLIGCFLTGFLLYTSGFGTFTLAVQRGLPMALIFTILFLKLPIVKKPPTNVVIRLSLEIVNLLLLVGNILCIFYVMIFEAEVALRYGAPNTWDTIACTFGFICVLEAARRATPPALFYIILGFIAYALWGGYIPGEFGHRGYPLEDLIQYLYLSNEGIFGLALGVMVNIIFIFLVLGTFLEATGVGRFIINLGLALTGRMRGGPALSAVVASALFGSISGSGSANVLATGTFTIPLMRKAGYSPVFAGAVEAAASTGGNKTPPVMASAAFVMSEILGIPYISICASAAIPALLYYLCVFLVIYLRACKVGLKPLPKEDRPSIAGTFREGGIFFLPIIFLVVLLIRGFTPAFSCFYSIVFCFILTLMIKSSRKSFRSYLDILATTANRSVTLFAALASIGVVIGVISLTGLGVHFSIVVTSIAKGHLFPALFLVMMAALLLSMGMPTLPAYLLVVVVSGIALQKLGVPPLVAHLFVFYFASMSTITPPVCLSAYAAAGISGGDPIKIGLQAVRLGIVGFIIPFMFAYEPALVLIGSVGKIFWAVIPASIGILGLALGMEGYLLGKVHFSIRFLFIIGGLLLIFPGSLTDTLGILIFAVSILISYLMNRFQTKKEVSEVPS